MSSHFVSGDILNRTNSDKPKKKGHSNSLNIQTWIKFVYEMIKQFGGGYPKASMRVILVLPWNQKLL